MKPLPKYNLLTSNLFIAGLIVLLLNDLYLKYHYPGVITGKLSDFAGLFIFPFFIAVFINRPINAYYSTAVFFVFWKLEISQPFIDTLSHITGLGIGRTVDAADITALIILPVSYQYYMKKCSAVKNSRLGFSTLIGFIAMFSFCATTLPRERLNDKINLNGSYVLPFSKQTFFEKVSFKHEYSNNAGRNMADSLFYLYLSVPEYRADFTVVAKIKQLGDDSTTIQIDSIISGNIMGRFFDGIRQSDIEAYKKMNAGDFEAYFEQNYINALSEGEENKQLFFDNKVILDKYINNRSD